MQFASMQLCSVTTRQTSIVISLWKMSEAAYIDVTQRMFKVKTAPEYLVTLCVFKKTVRYTTVNTITI